MVFILRVSVGDTGDQFGDWDDGGENRVRNLTWITHSPFPAPPSFSSFSKHDL
jgi:hypothetical protein